MPERVRVFLTENVETYEQLEALLLLRIRPEQAWSAAEVAGVLHIDNELAVGALDELCTRRLIEVSRESEHARYQLGSDTELRQIVDLVARANVENRLEIVRLMHVNAIKRMRATAARTFADAFLIRRKKNG